MGQIMGQCSLRRCRRVRVRELQPLTYVNGETTTQQTRTKPYAPESVNYHFHRVCNYNCGFCFHVAKNKDMAPLSEAEEVMRKLKEAGMKKINFSGGEPFLHADHLGHMVEFAKQTLQLASVSIVSNGSLITQGWIDRYCSSLDILAISCDSFDDATNNLIGRGQTKKEGQLSHVEQLRCIRKWCAECKSPIMFKLNTVLNKHNLGEDMSEHIAILRPVRWKVFQCLLIEGENVGEKAKRKNAQSFVIEGHQFSAWVDDQRQQLQARGMSPKVLIPESNTTMRNSYLILDEHCRFLNCTKGAKEPGPDLRHNDVSVEDALRQAGFDHKEYILRDGQYNWSKTTQHPTAIPLPLHHSSSSVASHPIDDIEDMARHIPSTSTMTGTNGVSIHSRTRARSNIQ